MAQVVLLVLTLALVFDWLFPLKTGPVDLAIAWWIPLVAGLGGNLLSNLFGSRNKPPAPPKYQYQGPDDLGVPATLPDGRPNPLYQFLQTGMIPGSGDPTVTNVSGSSTTLTDSTTKGTSKTFPTYLPQAQGVVDLLPNLLKHRVLEGGKVQPAEKMGVLNQIAGDASLAEKGLVNQLADRGFLGSPVEAGARESIARAGLGARANYLTQIPTIERQRSNEDLGVVNNILKSLFQGQQTDMQSRTTGRSDTTSSQTSETIGPAQFDPRVLATLLQQQPGQQQQGNAWDAFGNVSELLMMLWGMGAFDKGTSGKTRGRAPGPGPSPSGPR